jgi:hypothetical protein
MSGEKTLKLFGRPIFAPILGVQRGKSALGLGERALSLIESLTKGKAGRTLGHQKLMLDYCARIKLYDLNGYDLCACSTLSAS